MSLALELFMMVHEIDDEDVARKVFTPHVEFYERLVDVIADLYTEAFTDGVASVREVVSDIKVSDLTGSVDFAKGATAMLSAIGMILKQTEKSLSEFMDDVKTTG